MTTTNPPPLPLSQPDKRRVVDNVMNELIVKPTDAVLGQVGALGNDVAADVKGLGQLVLQPVVDILQDNPITTHHGSVDETSTADSVDMFAKTATAIFNSVVIYAIADIRSLIRTHRDQMIGDPDMIQQLITLPIKDVHVMMIVMQNISLLQQMMKKGEIDFYVAAVLRYRKELVDVTLEALSVRGTGTNDENDDRNNNNNAASANDVHVLSPTSAAEVVVDTATSVTPAPPPPARHTRTRRRSMFESIQQSPPQQNDNDRIPNTLEVFDDENSLKELVYGISINRCVDVEHLSFFLDK